MRRVPVTSLTDSSRDASPARLSSDVGCKEKVRRYYDATMTLPTGYCCTMKPGVRLAQSKEYGCDNAKVALGSD